MTRALRGLAALTLFAVAPLAAQNPVADRMLDLGGKPYPVNAACRLAGGDFRLTGATTKLSSAFDNRVPENKRRLLAEGRDLTLQSIQGGQAGSSKAWYFLGRFYLQTGDLAGADSAFTKVTQLSPTCAAEITALRRDAYVNLMSAASAQRAANHADSTAFLARAALLIEPGRPQAWYTVGAFFLDQQQNDSAAWYLEKAINAPMDSTANAQSIRQAAAYQVAVVEYNKRDFAGAVRNFAIAVRLKPDDNDAKRNLAAALRQAGMADSASKVEQSMMGAAAGSDAGLTVAQLFDIGVAQFNQQNFAAAGETFEKILATEPFHRDALFNLAQTDLAGTQRADSILTAARRALAARPRDAALKAAADTAALAQGAAADKFLATALRLQAMDPLSYSALQLVGAAYRAKNNQPKVLETATALGGATVDVQVTGFAITANGATLTIHAVGREGRDINDRVVRPVAIPIVVEFLNKDGAVVTTAEATVPALAGTATQDLPLTATGAGITAWRYHKK